MSLSGADEQDAADMARLAHGHEAALNDLILRHGRQIFHFLIRSLGDEEDAADLAQETFVRVFQNRARFRAGQKFTTWLYAIAANLVRDRYRFRTRHPQVSLEATTEAQGSLKDVLTTPELPPDESVQKAESADAVRKAIAALPEELRQPLVLAVYEELPQAEIAEVLKCSVKAVEMRIYRARQQLRESLAELVQAEG